MKLAALLLGAVAAGKGGKGGKHGNVDLEGTRYNWKIPKCITSPDFCQQDKIVTAKKGKIELSAKDYDNHRNVMYRIQLGDSRKIKLKFNQEAGFGMEWHRNCGYDKVHIFTGRADDFDNAQRIARFCGPKYEGGAPFDAAGNIKPIDGKMAMWDEWMDVGSGDVVVAIDLDQDRNDFKGFVLEYESEPTGLPDFSDFESSAKWLHETIMIQTPLFNLKNVRPPLVAAKNLYSSMINRSKQNKRCQKDFSSPVPTKLQDELMDIFNMPSSDNAKWDHAVYNSGKLMHAYLSDCPSGRSWISAGQTGKLRNIVRKRNNNLI